MCGIAGFLVHGSPARLDSDSVSPLGRRWESDALAMIDRIAHRGPDGQGLLVAPPIYLGHCRLAIIDPTPDGHQPMRDASGRYWISYNGEIYNYRELRRELEALGAAFRTQTDTEVLLHAYRLWGNAMLDRLDGMFAMAIWDHRQRSLWLARDSVGIKPLFYAALPDRFLFASEIKAILAASMQPEPDRDALGAFLAFGYAAPPSTGFAGIRQLLPGHEMTVQPGNPNPASSRWFRWPYPPKPARWSRWESAERLRDALEHSVSRQLRSDVPLGAFLSGGLDSSSIVACMASESAQPIHTFSVAMDSLSFDESKPAMAVAQFLGTTHHAPRIDASHFDRMRGIVRHAEDPIADNSLLPFWLLSETTSEHVKVALSGDGADELFAGYSTHRATRLARFYRGIPQWVREHFIGRISRALPLSEEKYGWSMLARRFVSAADNPWPLDHASWRLMLDPDYCRRLRTDDWSERLSRALEAYTAPLADAPGWLDSTGQMLHLDLAFHLPSDMLAKVDRMSMAHALEVRVPFLSKPVLETALAIPSRWKLRHGTGKSVLRDAMRSRLPKSIIERKKAGFVIPIERWLRGPWRAPVRELLTRDFCDRTQMLAPDGVRTIIEEHVSRDADHAYPLFTLLVLALWWQEWFDPANRSRLHNADTGRTRIERPFESQQGALS